ncbi:MAG: LysR family transcriptional regulator [Christensenellaceae bacterium]|nr:LysR family transcriptional regulator [Christensenellaceae bacterium]
MYNHTLDLFVLVAELGSFSKAAEKYFITPSAVIQKINHLEDDLNVRLLDRTKKGVTLTPAGQYLLSESKALIERSRDIRSHLQAFSDRTNRTVLFGTNQVHVAHLIYELWPDYSEKYPGTDLSSYSFNKDATDVLPNTDLIEGILYDEPAWQKGFTFYPLTYTRLSVLVSEDSSLASAGTLRPEQISGMTVVVIERGVSSEYDRIQDDLRKWGCIVEEVDNLSPSVIIDSLNTGKPVIIPNCWKDPHPHGRTVQFSPEYRMPYGFFLSRTASPAARDFIDHLKKHKPDIPPL